MFGSKAEEYLKHILEEIREFRKDFRRVHHHPQVSSFKIIQLGGGMVTGTIKGIAPGASGSFQAIPVDVNGNQDQLPAGVVPTWTSSDTTNAPVTPSADGLSATVAVPATAPGGTSFTLTVSATLPGGGTPTSGPTSVPFLSLQVTAFILNQTA